MANYLLVAGGTLAGGQPWSIRAYASGSGTEGATQAAWDSAFNAFWTNASWIALLPTTTAWTYSYTSTMSSNFHQTTATRNTHNVVGTSAGAPLPPQVCLVATLRTALANRAGRGRWYLPAPSATGLAATGNAYTPAAMTAVAGALNAMGTAISTSFQLQILHRNATKSGLAAMSLTGVTTADASNKPAIQRRRGDKVVPARSAWTP